MNLYRLLNMSKEEYERIDPEERVRILDRYSRYSSEELIEKLCQEDGEEKKLDHEKIGEIKWGLWPGQEN